MAIAISAGILVFRRSPSHLEVLLGHLGGPYWARRHESAWSIPKGIAEPGEELIDTAAREFTEELGLPVPAGTWVDLGAVRLAHKTVQIWAIEADLDVSTINPGEFELQWPPGSGRLQSFPELDRADWFSIEDARVALVAGQRPFLDRLLAVAD